MTTQHYISVTSPSNSGFQLANGTSNVVDGTSTSASDLVEVRWTDTGALATRVTRRQLLTALMLIYKHVLRGGFGGSDVNVPT